MQIPNHAPISQDKKKALELLLANSTPIERAWIAGYLSALDAQVTNTDIAPNKPQEVTILYGSESGNSEGLADEAKKAVKARGMKTSVMSMADVKWSQIAKVDTLLLITSTWGDGDPPETAVDFHAEVMKKDAASFSGDFAVCALGDVSYEKFCQTGKDFDQQLEKLGGRRLVPRQDCDVDFEEPFQDWLKKVVEELDKQEDSVTVVASPSSVVAEPQEAYSKKNPFPAVLNERILLNGRGSSKETFHLEFSLDGSGYTYEPGDVFAYTPKNASEDVEAVLKAGGFDPSSEVTLKSGEKKALSDALTNDFDITTLNKSVLQKYQDLVESAKLGEFLKDEASAVKDYLWGRQPVDMLSDFPVKGLEPQQFLGLMRKIPPRLYSIASSLKAHPDEVHLTIAVVRYESHGRKRRGVASTYVADRIDVGDTVPSFVNRNKNFKLPEDYNTPIIMVGPGTGVAPFRAFVEERATVGAKGKSWLFFGDQHYSYDFLYQLEWQDYLKDGYLTKLDLAFSRDQKHKVYVQNRMEQQAKEIYDWLENGAHFYVCGDAQRMAGDVHDMLINIVSKVGEKPFEDAISYVKDLQKSKRYQRDVY
ncbi:MAG: assimilatory sulfite reductase (NADPH) flavoprotein subunit [Verrucomicrobiota bacterium]